MPLTKVLHLKSAVTALPDGTIIGYPPLVDDPGDLPAVPAGAGGVGRARRAARRRPAADGRPTAPQTADLFADLGYEPVVVDISEFEKLEGCVTCLSVRLRGLG